MAKFLITIFLCFSVAFVFAQQNHFVYLQTYNNQPFYLRFQGKVLSSSSTGYLIIPKLVDGSYQFVIGFARNEFPEQVYSIDVKGNAGYELKNFPEKGWGLYDLQNAQVIMGGASQEIKKAETAVVPKKNDAFADMLSNVVKDSTIRVDDSVAVKPKEVPVVAERPVVKTPEVKENVPVLYSEIKRTLDNAGNDGLERVYVDNTGNGYDTISVFIPGNFEKPRKKVKKEAVKDPEVVSAPVVTTIDDTSKKATEDTTKKVVEVATAPPPRFIDDEVKKPEVKKERVVTENNSTSKLAMINSDCHATAIEDDFLKLRKKMAAERTDEAMLRDAKKAFKAKCYSTSFIKNLSVLFLTDQGRYSFFDTAYPYVPDSSNFPTLEKELSDEYYITRFRAMIHK